MSYNWESKWNNCKEKFRKDCENSFSEFNLDIHNPESAQNRIFQDLMRYSKGTVFWNDNKYSLYINNINDFNRFIPIRKYDDYLEPLADEFNTKGGILSNSPICRWLKTSGTTGTPKKIPYTLHWLEKYRVPAMKAMWGGFLSRCPDILRSPYSTLDTQTVRENVTDFIQGIPIQSISNRHPAISDKDWMPPWYDAPWNLPTESSRYQDKMLIRILSLLDKDVRFITVINPSTLVSLFDHLSEVGVYNSVPSYLRNYLGVNTLKAINILEKRLGRSDFNLNSIWPNLRYYSSWNSFTANLYSEKIKSILPRAQCMPFMCCGTEGVVTIPLPGVSDGQPLAINQGIYDFIPADENIGCILDSNNPPLTLRYDEVEIGKEYHVIQTQLNGLMRLYTGDIYRVVGRVGQVPLLSFSRRDGVYNSFTGEKITENEIIISLENVLNKYNVKLGVFLCGAQWDDCPYYHVVIPFNETIYKNEAELSDFIDKEVSHLNIEYASKRQSGRLGKFKVSFSKLTDIENFIDSEKDTKNINQCKYNPFYKDCDFLSRLSVF